MTAGAQYAFAKNEYTARAMLIVYIALIMFFVVGTIWLQVLMMRLDSANRRIDLLEDELDTLYRRFDAGELGQSK